MLIGVPAETTAGETRVAVTPETAKKLKAQGHTLRIQSGAGVPASATDEAPMPTPAITEQSMPTRMTLRVPILREDAMGVLGCQLIDQRHDVMAAIHRELSSGAKIILHIDDQEG